MFGPPFFVRPSPMDVSEFDFALPPELIAQRPASNRGSSRLLYLPRHDGDTQNQLVADLPRLLRAGDLLVVNDTKVFPARLIGRRAPSGGAVECLLVARVEPTDETSRTETSSESAEEVWEALVHPGQKLKPGARLMFDGPSIVHAEVLERRFFGRRLVRLWTEDRSPLRAALDVVGHVPLPPYIKRPDEISDRARYQTIFAARRGSVAAPTAGLHFSEPLVAALQSAGVAIVAITLHVGYGTFQPVRVASVEDHRMQPEHYEIGGDAAHAVNAALSDGRRVIAVGTTTTRTLEGVALRNAGKILAGKGSTDLFIHPGFRFQVITGLLTNFHLPRSSLLMLVSAFAGRDRVLAAYATAVQSGYRFYSYGDAMLVL